MLEQRRSSCREAGGELTGMYLRRVSSANTQSMSRTLLYNTIFIDTPISKPQKNKAAIYRDLYWVVHPFQLSRLNLIARIMFTIRQLPNKTMSTI